MKPTIIGFFLRHEIRTGAHKRYLELLNNLSTRGWDVLVLLSSTINSSDYSFKTIPLEPVHVGKLPFSIKQAIRILPVLFRLDKKRWVNIVFGETNYLSSKLCQIILRAKIIFAFRSNSYKAKKDQHLFLNTTYRVKERFNLLKMKNIEKKIVNLSDLLVFQTTYDRDDIQLRTGFDLSKSVIIPNSVRESWFLKQYQFKNCSKELKNIVYLGNYDDRKGAMFLLQAFKILKDRNMNISLELFGGGNEIIKLKKYAEDNELTEHVTINGKMLNPVSKLGDYDLMVTPSIYDSYPNVILEALFTGTPVLASDNSGMKAILEDERLLFKTADPEEIADKIEQLYRDKELYLSVKEICRDRTHYHDFSWSERFEKVIDL